MFGLAKLRSLNEAFQNLVADCHIILATNRHNKKIMKYDKFCVKINCVSHPPKLCVAKIRSCILEFKSPKFVFIM